VQATTFLDCEFQFHIIGIKKNGLTGGKPIQCFMSGTKHQQPTRGVSNDDGGYVQILPLQAQNYVFTDFLTNFFRPTPFS
jgi:hypothetical protein